VDEEEVFTPEELAAQREKELQSQQEKKMQLERERMEAQYQKNKRVHERRRQKEDEHLSRLQKDKSLRLDEGLWTEKKPAAPKIA
jgi:hypothetical protein